MKAKNRLRGRRGGVAIVKREITELGWTISKVEVLGGEEAFLTPTSMRENLRKCGK